MTTTSNGFGNHAPDWEPSGSPAGAIGMAEIAEKAKADALKPTQSDMSKAFGEPVEEAGGKLRWRVDRRVDRHAFGKWKELSQAHRRAEIERSQRWNARPKVPLVDPKTGGQVMVFAEDEELVASRRGYRRPRPFGRMNSVEWGPDGMAFRWMSGWMPTGRTCLGTPLDGSSGEAAGLQRDPGGGLWAKRDGEWRELMDGEPFTDEEFALLKQEA